LLDEILKLNVIVQGALGSALFWLIAYLGEKLVRRLGLAFGKFSTNHQLEKLRSERLRYMALEANTDHTSANLAITALIYTSLYNITRGLIMLVLGLIFGSVLPVLATVGYLMAIYYFFLASHAVRDTDDDVDPSTKLKEINAMIEKLEAKNN